MTKTEQLIKELNEAKAELIEVDKEYSRLEFHRKHLHEIIRDRKMQLSALRSVLAPVTVTLYDRDSQQSITERHEHVFNRVDEATEKFDFSKYDYMDMGISCGWEEDDFSAIFSMDLGKLSQVIAKGKVMIVCHNGYWMETEDYYTGVLESPTYFYALQEFHKSIYTTKDKHHQFLEAISPIGGSEADKLAKKHGEGIQFFEFCTGS
jgi:hypothetical protein